MSLSSDIDLEAIASRTAAVVQSVRNILSRLREAGRSTIIEIYDGIPDGTKPENYLATAASRGKLDRRLKALSKEATATLLQRDRYLQSVVKDEYAIEWLMYQFMTANLLGFNVDIGDPKGELMERAFNYRFNKLANSEALALSRRATAQRVLRDIEQSLASGVTPTQATKNLDVVLGFRTTAGDLTDFAKRKIESGQLTIRGGEIYNSLRVWRTESATMRHFAKADGMKVLQEDGYPARLMKISVLDTRTRPQSAQMDGDMTDVDGRLLYPDGRRYFMGEQPAKWRINDRGTLGPVMDGNLPEIRSQRSPDGQVTVDKWKSFKQYADEFGIKKNVYGQVLFP